jgi:hypothetical protein
MAAAFGQLGPHHVKHSRRFGEEIGCRVDDKSPRVPFPDAQDPQVYRRSFDRRFGAQRISSVVTVLKGWSTQMNHRVVPQEFVRERRMHVGEEIFGARPVRGAIDRTAVAEDDRGVRTGAGFFKLALDVENGALRGPSRRCVRAPRKPTAEDDTGRFRKNVDVLAKGRTPDEFKRCRLAGTWAAREYDTARNMRIRAVAGDHGSSALQMDTVTVPTCLS